MDDAVEGAGDHEDEADAVLEARGLTCPLPVLKAKKRLAALQPGQRLLVLATDPRAVTDLAELCRASGDTILARHEAKTGSRVLILRGKPPA